MKICTAYQVPLILSVDTNEGMGPRFDSIVDV